MARHRGLTPSYQHLFFTRGSLTILTLGIVLGQVPWMLLHESYHALAGRRLGLNSKLGIGRRFYYVVFETSLDGLVAVPRRKRYLPMLAGMLLDVLVIAGLTLAADGLRHTHGFWALVAKLLLSMAFGVVLRLAWQFYFFLRTDLYFLAMTVLGCNDLQTASRQLLANRVNHLLGRRDHLVEESAWTQRDAEVARWYSWLMVAGYCAHRAAVHRHAARRRPHHPDRRAQSGRQTVGRQYRRRDRLPRPQLQRIPPRRVSGPAAPRRRRVPSTEAATASGATVTASAL